MAKTNNIMDDIRKLESDVSKLTVVEIDPIIADGVSSAYTIPDFAYDPNRDKLFVAYEGFDLTEGDEFTVAETAPDSGIAEITFDFIPRAGYSIDVKTDGVNPINQVSADQDGGGRNIVATYETKVDAQVERVRIDTIEQMMDLSNPVGTIKAFETAVIGDKFITDMATYSQTWEKLTIQDGLTLIADSVGGLTSTSGSVKSHNHQWGSGFSRDTIDTSTGIEIRFTGVDTWGSDGVSQFVQGQNRAVVSSNTYTKNSGGDDNLAAGLKVVYYRRIL